jgi:hypothetical protein
VPDILGRRALPAGRLAALGATPGLAPRAPRGRPVSRILKIGGIVVVCLIVLLVTLRTTGFEPMDCPGGHLSWRCRAPGLWLKGDLVTAPVTDWAFTDKYQTIKVETRDWFGLPHSVVTWCVAYDGELYLMSSYREGVQYPHGRRWNENVARDPRVRLKIGDQLYERVLVHVTDPGIRAGVLSSQARKYPRAALTPGPSVHVFRVVDAAPTSTR